MRSFWQELAVPVLALAPLHDVTDVAFRKTVAACGKPDVCFTEFTSVDGITHPASSERMLRRYLQIDENEHPVVAQLWGNDPSKFETSARTVATLGFDGIDINMGCPDATVIKHGGGAALINEPERAADIIRAVRAGAPDLPVSVKTRTGFDTDIAEEWISKLLETGIDALTLHARTMKERSRVPARWERVRDIATLVERVSPNTVFLGNGDVRSLGEAHEKVAAYGCDGVMIGRGIFGNLWFFNRERNGNDIPIDERLDVLVRYARDFEEHYTGMRGIRHIFKTVHATIAGFPGAKELRMQIFEVETAADLADVVAAWKREHLT